MSAKRQVFPIVSLINQKPVTTSLNIADVFGKQHNNVLRTIQNLEVPEEFDRLNFEPISYQDSYDRTQSMYQITRDGFIILVMGFTGARAMQFKIAYIAAFNRMEEELAHRSGEISRRVAPEIWAQIRKSHRGIKLGLRVRLLDICCQLSRLAEAPQSKEEVLQDYAELCESMREQDALPAGGGEIRSFLDARCVFGQDLSVRKEDLYNAYREYASEEDLTVLERAHFFRALYQVENLRHYHKRVPGGAERHLRGIALNPEARTASACGGLPVHVPFPDEQGQPGREVRHDN